MVELAERLHSRMQELLADFKSRSKLPPPGTRSFTGHELVQSRPVGEAA